MLDKDLRRRGMARVLGSSPFRSQYSISSGCLVSWRKRSRIAAGSRATSVEGTVRPSSPLLLSTAGKGVDGGEGWLSGKSEETPDLSLT